MSHLLLMTLLAFALSTPTARAATVQTCMSTAKKSKSDCEKSFKSAIQKSQDSGKKAAPKAVGANQQAAALTSAVTASNGELTDTIKKCEDLKKSCQSDCDPSGAQDETSKSTMTTKKQDCEKTIDDYLKQAKDGIAGGDAGAKGAGETGDKAGADDKKKEDQAQPPPQSPQQPQQSDDKPKSQDKTADTKKSDSTASAAPASIPPITPPTSDSSAQKAPDCKTDANAYQDSRCVTDMKKKCGTSSSGECSSFRSLYCGKSAGGAPPTFSGGLYQPLAGGEGSGSEFCLAPASLAFCDESKEPAHHNCPSCAKARGESVNLSSVDVNTCGGDPLYSSPTQVASLKAQSTGGGSSAGGGGGGGSSSSTSGGAGATLDAAKGKTDLGHREGQASGLGSLDAGGGGGGGGGGSHSGGMEAESLTYDPSLDKRSPAGVGVPGVTDVEFRHTQPMVFSILDGVMRTRCAKNQFLHPCGKR